MLTNDLVINSENAASEATVLNYTRFDELVNRSVYNSATHDYALRDTLGFYRTLPKRAGNFMGTKKSALKFTRDQSVPGADATTTNVAPMLFDLAASIPVGTPTDNIIEGLNDLAALISDQAFIMKLVDDLEY
jgi:hypothetical protein